MIFNRFTQWLLPLALVFTLNTSYAAPSTLDLSHLPQIEEVDLLAINNEIKGVLDRSIDRGYSKRTILSELHLLLFKPAFLGIEYDLNATNTAQETFDKGVGNCLSHAALYIAAARHLGLKARFQSVKTPPQWMNAENYYVVPGHINALVNATKRDAYVIEFADAYSVNDTMTYKSKVISDKEALAEYYNNIGMQYMGKEDYRYAIAYFKKATKTNKHSSFGWSNLGVAYKISGHLELAEQAYKKAMHYDKRNLSIINNVYILYKQTGNKKEAEKLYKRVLRHSKKNPYYLYKLAQTSITLGDNKEAIKFLKKAIEINDSESNFYTKLAYAYHLNGEAEKSIQALESAEQHATSMDEMKRFKYKVNYLKQHAGL